jgi:hypothetical protein
MCRLVINAIQLFGQNSVLMPKQVILKFSIFGKTTEKHPYGGETTYTERRICIFLQSPGAPHPNSSSCLIGLIQCHHPPLAKDVNTWDLEHSPITVQSLFSGRVINPLQINFEQLRSWISLRLPDPKTGYYRTEKRKDSLMAKMIKMRAIDIGGRMVRDVPDDCTYAALSYVWG